MNDSNQNDAAAVRFPPPLVAIATIALGVILGYIWPLDFGLRPFTPERYWIGGAIIVAAIAGLVIWPSVLFRRTGQSEIPWTPTPEIIVEGPYHFTRNPMYLAMVLICVGFTVLLAKGWILILTPLCAFLLYRIAIKPEEAYLEGKFGDSYRAYKARVRRWI